MRKKRSFLIIAIVLVVVAIIGVMIIDSKKVKEKNSNKIQITTSIYPLQYLVQKIGGDTVEVNSIYPINGDIHTYEATSKDIKNILDSDVFFYISDSLEPYGEIAENSVANKESNVKVVNIVENSLFKVKIGEKAYSADGNIKDPHIWLSPRKTKVMMEVIRNKLSSVSPENKELYSKNFDKLNAKLNEINQEYITFAKTQKKPIFVAHDAYYWLREDYGIDIIGMYGNTHEDEPSAKDIKNAIDLVKKDKISMIFAEQNDKNNKAIVQVASETGAKIEELNNLATQTSKHEDYFNELEKNIALMQEVG